METPRRTVTPTIYTHSSVHRVKAVRTSQPERDLFSPVLPETAPDIDPTRAEATFTQEHKAHESEETETEVSIPIKEPKLNEQPSLKNNDNWENPSVKTPSDDTVRRYPGRERKPPLRYY